MEIPKWLTVEFLNRILSEGQENESRVRYLKIAKDCAKWYFKQHGIMPVEGYDDMTISEGQAIARINKIKETLDKENSILLKNNPIVRRWPLLEGDAELSDNMDSMSDQAWEETHGQDVLSSMLQEAQIGGMSVCKIHWNPLNTYYNPAGSIAIEKLSPESIIFDPKASNMHRAQDCRYIIHHTKPPLDWFLERYKDEGAEALGLRERQGRKSGNFVKGIAKYVKEFIVQEKETEQHPMLDVYEFWLWPHTMYTSELVSGDVVKPNEFPYGLVVTMANNTILKSKVMPNPFVTKKSIGIMGENGFPGKESREIGHKRAPFVPLYWMRTGDREGNGTYGIYDCMGAVEPMIPLQFNVDALRRNVAINARTIANNTILGRAGAIENPLDTIKFDNGQILVVKDNYPLEQSFKILQGTPMPQQVFELIMNDVSEIEKAAGLEPGVVGLFPPGGTSHTPAMTIGSLQESAFGPLWVFVREISNALLDMSVLYDGLIQQKYPPGRYMNVSRTGQQYFVEWNERHIAANFKRRIVNGSTTPLFDVEKDQRMANVATISMQAVLSKDPVIIELAIAQIEAMNYPWAMQFIQILNTNLEKINQLERETQALGMAGLQQAQQMQNQPQELPAGEEETDYSGVEELGAELGIDPAELVAGIESQ